jgi:hypothetical protein
VQGLYSAGLVIGCAIVYFCVMNIARRYLPGPIKDALFSIYASALDTWKAIPFRVYAIKARLTAGHRVKTILFYPQQPKPDHVIYKMLHRLGHKITSNPKAKADIVINFEPATYGSADLTLVELSKKYNVLNLRFRDISKVHIEQVFRQVFGYGACIDPLTYEGPCVRKSNKNALHDGTIVHCPLEPEDGYVYQRVINNQYGDIVQDIRVPLIGGTIPFVYYKYRSAGQRFSVTNARAKIVETQEALNCAEQAKIMEFGEALGLDVGELDILRDRDSGLIYITDAANTPWGPPNHTDEQDAREAVRALAACFQERYLA